VKGWISTPKPLAGAPPASKPAQNLRSQPHGSRRALSLWCWDYEAREEGYYAAHCYPRFEINIPTLSWVTEATSVEFEIQVTTQLQDVIRNLTHDYYELRRSRKTIPDMKWQWDYKGPEFVPNYLGHILHYVEGMIMEVRMRGASDER